MLYTFSHYCLTTHLAHKNGCDVYLAYSTDEPGHFVVLKMFDADRLAPSVHEHDIRQLETQLRRLQHPHIVPILELSIEEGKPYIVSEHISGGSLRHYIQLRDSKHLMLDEAVDIVTQVGEAVALAHENAVIHQRIRPENILLNDPSDVLLTDFQLGTIITNKQPEDHADKHIVSYLAPEQLLGSVSFASDQYALGCLLYELITGTLPDLPSLWQRASLPTTKTSTLQGAIENVMLRALAMKPEDRYPDVASFLTALKLADNPAPPAFPFAHLMANHQLDNPVTRRSDAQGVSLSNQDQSDLLLSPANQASSEPLVRQDYHILSETTPSHESLPDQEDFDDLSFPLENSFAPLQEPPTPPVNDESLHLISTPEDDDEFPAAYTVGPSYDEENDLDLSFLQTGLEDPSTPSSQEDDTNADAEDAAYLPIYRTTSSVNPFLQAPQSSPQPDPALTSQHQFDSQPLSPWFADDETKQDLPVSNIQQSSRGASNNAQSRNVLRIAPPRISQMNAAQLLTIPSDWKRPMVLLAIALTLTIIATLLASSFNASVAATVKNTPNLVIVTRTPKPSPTARPLPTPTPKPAPTATPKPKPTPTPKPKPTHTPKPAPTTAPTSVPTLVPTPTPTFFQAATSGTPVYYSAMATPDNGHWDTLGSGGTSCSYAQGAYQIKNNLSSSYLPCYANNLTGSNFTFQFRMVVTPSANDGGGVIFRHTNSSEYRLRMGTDGSYDLATPAHTLLSGTSAAFYKGAGQSNVITIIAYSANIYIYVNGVRIAYVSDTSSASGTFGFFAVDFSHSTTALFSNVTLW